MAGHIFYWVRRGLHGSTVRHTRQSSHQEGAKFAWNFACMQSMRLGVKRCTAAAQQTLTLHAKVRMRLVVTVACDAQFQVQHVLYCSVIMSFSTDMIIVIRACESTRGPVIDTTCFFTWVQYVMSLFIHVYYGPSNWTQNLVFHKYLDHHFANHSCAKYLYVNDLTDENYCSRQVIVAS